MSNEKSTILVKTFFDPTTFTAQHVLVDCETKLAAIIDPVLDFDPVSGRTRTDHAEQILQYGKDQGLSFKWILETHAHADHLSAANFLKQQTGAKVAIGRGITKVQAHFSPLFDFEPEFSIDGIQFDLLLDDGDQIELGSSLINTIATPGHTPACVTYQIADALFIGDTLFMPDYGSARTDFPGGDAAQLYHSVQKLYAFPDKTKMFLCHDYKTSNRDEFVWETTVGDQKRQNIHLRADTSEQEFVRSRNERDSGLNFPKLILPSLQINLRGGVFPPPAANGISYLKLPINLFGKP